MYLNVACDVEVIMAAAVCIQVVSLETALTMLQMIRNGSLRPTRSDDEDANEFNWENLSMVLLKDPKWE